MLSLKIEITKVLHRHLCVRPPKVEKAGLWSIFKKIRFKNKPYSKVTFKKMSALRALLLQVKQKPSNFERVGGGGGWGWGVFHTG